MRPNILDALDDALPRLESIETSGTLEAAASRAFDLREDLSLVARRLRAEHAAARPAPSAAAIEAALDDMVGALQRYANLGDFAKVKDAVRSGLEAAYRVDFGATEEAPDDLASSDPTP